MTPYRWIRRRTRVPTYDVAPQWVAALSSCVSSSAFACSAPPPPPPPLASATHIAVARVKAEARFPDRVARATIERMLLGSASVATVPLVVDVICRSPDANPHLGDRVIAYLVENHTRPVAWNWVEIKWAALGDPRVVMAFPAQRRSLMEKFGGGIPRGDPASWVSNDDYPPSARRTRAEGKARAALRIASDGRIADCTITGSSGHPDLDQATCANLLRRARFKPPILSGERQSSYEHEWRLPNP